MPTSQVQSQTVTKFCNKTENPLELKNSGISKVLSLNSLGESNGFYRKKNKVRLAWRPSMTQPIRMQHLHNLAKNNR